MINYDIKFAQPNVEIEAPVVQLESLPVTKAEASKVTTNFIKDTLLQTKFVTK